MEVFILKHEIYSFTYSFAYDYFIPILDVYKQYIQVPTYEFCNYKIIFMNFLVFGSFLILKHVLNM